MDNRPIGVFDSGIGGLTVVKSLIASLPNEKIYYVGDTARVPYGNKSQDRIQEFSKEIVQWLIRKNCKIIIVACNTASSLALEVLKKEFSIPIFGVIDPGVNYAINATINNSLGILGTEATILSNSYGEKLKFLNPNIKVISKACPLFVPLVEEGLVQGAIPLSIAKFYLDDFVNSDIDTVILGCTHYPILKDVIKETLGREIHLVDSGEATATMVAYFLDSDNLNRKVLQGEIKCFVTDSPNSFGVLASRFLKNKITSIKHIDL